MQKKVSISSKTATGFLECPNNSEACKYKYKYKNKYKYTCLPGQRHVVTLNTDVVC